MTVETANRLVQMRKERGLSQEALAEKLGVSRQAVSKWERAEASPDTDNLIMIARLYGISLDDLLGHKPNDDEENNADDFPDYSNPDGSARQDEDTNNEDASDGKEADGRDRKGASRVHINRGGIHVDSTDGAKVRIDNDGIYVYDPDDDEDITIDRDGVRMNGEKVKDKKWERNYYSKNDYVKLPFATIFTIAYLVIGLVWNLWHPGWILFLMIPVCSSLVSAIAKRNPRRFAYPVFVTALYLFLGFIIGWWHPGWILFLTIPLFYSVLPSKRKKRIRARGRFDVNSHKAGFDYNGNSDDYPDEDEYIDEDDEDDEG